MKMRVYYEDTDINKIVYHANYIKYCERARSELFFAQGILPIVGENGYFVVKDLQADFKGSLTLGDEFEVKTSNKALRRSFVVLTQEVFHNKKCIFSMDITLVYMQDQSISKIPENFKDILLGGNL